MTIATIGRDDPTYPEPLREIASPPQQLYSLGELDTDRPLIAIVGTRKASAYGREVTRQLSGELARAGIGIVSGLALGIDAVAHRAALEAGGYTVAVMACGLDRLYPARNRQLGKDILAGSGAIISEYEAGMPPLKQHFPARNRIVAGLAHATLVTEAGEGSGALITANFALEQNREVLAVPGNITQAGSQGTNRLIQAGATPVTGTEDILTCLDLSAPADQPPPQPASVEEARILELLAEGALDSGSLIEQTEWEAAEFNRIITLMEISGKIRRISGDTWIIRT